MSLIRASEQDEQLLVRPLVLETATATPDLPAGSGEARLVHGDEVRVLREALAASEAKRDQLVAAAREQGRRDASAAHKRDEAAYTAMLADGIKASVMAFQAKVEELNLSAVTICENVLARLIGDTSNYGDLISAAVSRQLEAIQQETIIAILVSAADFPNQAALDAIATESGVPKRLVTQDQSIASGSCRIELRLGAIDISLPAYHEALQATLAQLKLRGRRP